MEMQKLESSCKMSRFHTLGNGLQADVSGLMTVDVYCIQLSHYA